jgi:RNA polymerase sigma-70 factor (ECF subfamily)
MSTGSVPEAVDLRKAIVAHLPRLRRFCMALARNADAGDDLCQATVERALARAAQFIPGTRLDSWMYRIAQNIQIDQGRRLRTRGTEIAIDDAFDLSGDDGVAIVEGRSSLARARSAMAALPDDQRALIALVVLDGKSYREAADILEIPIGTVMSRIARARRSIDLFVNGGVSHD